MSSNTSSRESKPSSQRSDRLWMKQFKFSKDKRAIVDDEDAVSQMYRDAWDPYRSETKESSKRL